MAAAAAAAAAAATPQPWPGHGLKKNRHFGRFGHFRTFGTFLGVFGRLRAFFSRHMKVHVKVLRTTISNDDD